MYTTHLSRTTRKPTLWTLPKVSTRISLSMSNRLTRIHFSPPVDFLFQESLPYSLSPWDGMCWPGSVCVDWSGSIHYAEAIMLVFLAGRLIWVWLHSKLFGLLLKVITPRSFVDRSIVVSLFSLIQTHLDVLLQTYFEKFVTIGKLLMMSNFSFCSQQAFQLFNNWTIIYRDIP